MHEIGLLALSKHPNIVALLSAFYYEAEVCLVMEFMGGGKLTDYVLRRRRFPENIIAYVVKMTLRALAYMHRLHRLHRDIKSDNILIREDGAIKIADFGFATSLANDRKFCASMAGTPCWYY